MFQYKIQLGSLLLENKLITQAQLDEAIDKQAKSGKKLGQIILELGFVQEHQLIQLLSDQLHIPFIDLKSYSPDFAIVNLLPEIYARRFRCIVLSKDENSLLVGMVDPLDVPTYDEIANYLKKPIRLAIVKEADLLITIGAIYRQTVQIQKFASELSKKINKNQYDVNVLNEGLSAQDVPIVKLLKSIFEDAAQVNASDIHIEPDESILRIRLRVYGVLQEQIIPEQHIAKALALRLKLMAGLNIAETRLPQDGRFSIKAKNKSYDVRVSILPIEFGESIVLRLLEQSSNIIQLTDIGMPAEMLERVRSICSMPNGMLLLTGPTGSGKSTTLYGLLSEVNEPGVKIITVEDPIEYQIHRINQVQVQPKIDLTFANILRSVLRQDPDIIMIGELRDKETVDIALRAALTGHFVYSTLHTNDSKSAAIRLLDMGADSFIVASVLRAVIAQRLIRKICTNCVTDYQLSVQEQIWIAALTGSKYRNKTFKKGAGCNHCHHTGYLGQTGVFELFEMSKALAHLLSLNKTNEFMNLIEQDNNSSPLLTQCLDLVLQDVTTIAEVIRNMGQATIKPSHSRNKPIEEMS